MSMLVRSFAQITDESLRLFSLWDGHIEKTFSYFFQIFYILFLVCVYSKNQVYMKHKLSDMKPL